MKLEDLTDIMVAQVPGRLYNEMKRVMINVADELSEITKKRFMVGAACHEIGSYLLPLTAGVLNNSLGLGFFAFVGSSLIRAVCYKAIRSKDENNDRGFDSGDFQDPLDPSPDPSLKKVPPIEDRVTDYYWQSVERNRQRTLN